MVEKYGQKWSEEETILAFYLYCQVPFSKITKTNPDIIRLAKILGRTPSSVGLKMANLAHFDPELRRRNRTGMSNASKLDEAVANRFCDNWEELTFTLSFLTSYNWIYCFTRPCPSQEQSHHVLFRTQRRSF